MFVDSHCHIEDEEVLKLMDKFIKVEIIDSRNYDLIGKII